MRRTFAVVLGLGWLVACADMEESWQELDPEEADLGQASDALAGPVCSVQTQGHGLVTGGPTTVGCRLNHQCNKVGPVCAAPEDNTCVCTQRSGSNCLAGQCVWHVDPAITTCVCVPGQVQRCTPPGGAALAGFQECKEDGSAWETCVAMVPATAP